MGTSLIEERRTFTVGQRSNTKFTKLATGLYHAANHVLRIVGSVIMLILFWYCLRYTQHVIPGSREVLTNQKDSVLQNILALCLCGGATVLCTVGERHLSENAKQKIMRFAAFCAMLWMGIMSFWWIYSANRVPEGDQAYLYGGASYFLEGQYSFLGASGYCGMYPYQLGLIALMELLFLAVGTYQYFAFEVICASMTVGIVFFGYRFLREITASMTVIVLYCLFISMCLPLAFYSSWVYGDIPSIFFVMLGAWMLVRYSKRHKKSNLVILVIAMTMAVLVRQSSLIHVAALGIVGIVYALKEKDKRVLVAVLAAALLHSALYAGIYKLYEVRSGFEHSEGIPTVTWFVMGMQENNGMYGVDNSYPKDLYAEHNFDSEKTARQARKDLKERVDFFAKNPAYSYAFYKGKVLEQWNVPLYQSLYFNTKYLPENVPGKDTLVYKIGNSLFPAVLKWCDNLQLFIYGGMLLYFLFGIKKDSDILQQMLAAALIGGFLFSIIWEAKARYVFPFYVTTFPLAALGYWQTVKWIQKLIGRLKGKMTCFFPKQPV